MATEANKEFSKAVERLSLRDYRDFLCGEADGATRELVWKALQDPESTLGGFVRQVRVSGDRMLGRPRDEDHGRSHRKEV